MEPVVFVTGPLAVNTLIIGAGPGRCLVVDPGGDSRKIIAYISREGLVPAGIVLTHGHWDHLAGLAELTGAWLPDWPAAELAVHADDASWLGLGAVSRHRAFFETFGAGELVDPSEPELNAPTRLLREGDDFFGWKILHTPGHSPGSVCLYREEDSLLVSGDTLFRSGYGRTDGPGGSDAALAGSLRRLLALPPAVRAYPGHGGATTVALEREGYSL